MICGGEVFEGFERVKVPMPAANRSLSGYRGAMHLCNACMYVMMQMNAFA